MNMSERLYRGKRKDDGKWVEGFFVKRSDDCLVGRGEHYIVNCDVYGYCWHKVCPDTVGQYIGLTDKNGTKIFEGDITNIEFTETTVKNAVIEYIVASFYGSTHADAWELNNYYQLEIIGNIHDNPELMKGGE